MNKTQVTTASRLDLPLALHRDHFLRAGILKLLAIKDSDIRILTLEQSRDAVDSGLHAGGAFSATIPLVALFYGGFLRLDIEDPTSRGQDIFTLSKGHAVAAMASMCCRTVTGHLLASERCTLGVTIYAPAKIDRTDSPIVAQRCHLRER